MPDNNKQEPEKNNQQTQEPETNWEYNSSSDASLGGLDDTSVPSALVGETVSWNASEYVAHEKDFVWYMIVGAVIFGFAALVYIVDDDHGWFSPLLIIVAGITFIVAAKRPPKVLEYVVDETGVHVGSKLYAYSQFKSFSIIQEGAITSIMLTPLQRFMPSLSIYYEPKDEQKIADALSVYLPHESKKQDPIDALMRKIRF